MSNVLYVTSGRKSVDLKAVEDLFATVGDDERSMKDDKLGVFEMSNAQQAADCAERFHGHSFSGHVLCVSAKRPVPPKPLPPVAMKRGRAK